MPPEPMMRRRALLGAAIALGGCFGLAAFPFLAGQAVLSSAALFGIGAGLAFITSAGAILTVFSLRRTP